MASLRTEDEILAIARVILAEDGLGGLTFDAIAARLGRTKQAVIYWYANMQALRLALFLPWLRAEADAARAALRPGLPPAEAIAAVVRAIAGFHLGDLDRFRMMYLAPQTGRPAAQGHALQGLENVPAETDRLYAALAARLPGAPDSARRRAFAIHAAVLGQVMMIALADALGDPLKHTDDELIAALIDSLAPG